ncbi:Rha family transcriptional regulator [Burkholderia thailandensis]|uniref:Rha family transcriptional regulator n=1 Tax=Burkholderia thailandensis TaxID=57975 RepID=UPI00107EBDF8|nr:Rha family transcriptional regulator [Burkholderia thailandensis]TGB34378.1 Rha family transcriptional regulator [Burkholderia thailandensis]
MEIDPNFVIDRLGGTSAVARLFEIEPPSVSEWRRTGIPKPRLQYLKLAYPHLFEPDTGVTVPAGEAA